MDEESRALGRGGNEPACIRTSVTRGYEAVPNTCGRDEHGAQVYRSPESQGTTPTKIMVLGDSIAAQHGWPSQLAADFAKGPPARAVAVYSFGLSGYDVCQELATYRESVASVQPDLLLLQTCPNDVRGGSILQSVGGRVRQYTTTGFVDFPAWVLHSRFLTLAMLRFGPRAPAETSTPLSLLTGCVSELRDEVAARKLPMLVVFFPVFFGRDPALRGYLADEDAVRSVLTASGVSYLDLRPALEAVAPLGGGRALTDDLFHPRGEEEGRIAGLISQAMGDMIAEPAR